MKYKSVTMPQYADEERTAINCWVQFDEFKSPVPFTASKNDCEEHSVKIYEELIAGKYGKIEASK